jgi:hypothetical protein
MSGMVLETWATLMATAAEPLATLHSVRTGSARARVSAVLVTLVMAVLLVVRVRELGSLRVMPPRAAVSCVSHGGSPFCDTLTIYRDRSSVNDVSRLFRSRAGESAEPSAEGANSQR